jgi:hypothetical protein
MDVVISYKSVSSVNFSACGYLDYPYKLQSVEKRNMDYEI